MADNAGSSTVTLAAGVATQVFARRTHNRRVAYSITNAGANVAYICPADHQIAVAGQGIELRSGTTTFDSDNANYNAFSGGISAISTLGTTLSCWYMTM